MGVGLQKGGNVSLSKEEPGLAKIRIGLGWDARSTDGSDFDLDASAFMLEESGKVSGDDQFIFYNQTKSPCGSVVHMGDNRTGAGSGDDEVLLVNLPSVPARIKAIAFTVTIHEAVARKQNFGQVRNAYIRVMVDDTAQKELARYDLSEDASTETAMVFGEVYRHGEEWKFRAIGQGYQGGLSAMCRQYGVNV